MDTVSVYIKHATLNKWLGAADVASGLAPCLLDEVFQWTMNTTADDINLNDYKSPIYFSTKDDNLHVTDHYLYTQGPLNVTTGNSLSVVDSDSSTEFHPGEIFSPPPGQPALIAVGELFLSVDQNQVPFLSPEPIAGWFLSCV
ncbi:hypothetical protein [Paraburkholderia humisilvae]|uniref:Uncharacterized protein n=1 Tax=Paraburkholderia humisilvae TaxID=627669 RepID=A0A6J5FBA5_9BURK|nr:hypothetical protein [Paraburkholderia humisilvae]CAB3775002.1 hypothetical protein LMG29542_08384 [Paraburkholderia humisilvae]